jgi:hypothetical protein
MDASFCAQFIKDMHLQGTPRFHTLSVYDKVAPKMTSFRIAKGLAIAVTERPSSQYNLFMQYT